MFQSTRPRGARRFSTSCRSVETRFNPRAHAGRDKRIKSSAAVNSVSIHAPTRGATLFQIPQERRIIGFQSTRPRGARQDTTHQPGEQMPFQSTRPRGARPHSKIKRHPSTAFQSTRPRGARLRLIIGNIYIRCFNPRAHAGRDSTIG